MKLDRILIVLTVILSACSNEQIPASFDSKVTLSLSGKNTDIVTTKGNLPVSTKVGVYALQTGVDAATLANTPFKNALYIANGSDEFFSSISPIVLESKKPYRVCAYAPFLETIPSDASAISFIHGTDVLYAPITPITISSSVASAELNFEHKMSQIKFILVSGLGSPILAGAKLSVTGFNESCTLNLDDGVITPILGKGSTVSQIDQFVCFVPDSSLMNLAVKITTIDNWVCKGTISRVFKSSESYTYTLTVSKTELGIVGEVVNWELVNGGNLNVTE